MEVKDTVMNIDAQDKSTWDEACLHPHHRGVADIESAKTFAIGGNPWEVCEVVWKKRGTLECARWHAGLFECLVRIGKVIHEDLLGPE